MTNPFAEIDARLSMIETLLLDIKHAPLGQKLRLPENQIIGLTEVKHLTGYSSSAIYQKTSKNEIPHFKRDNKLFFRRDDIVSWITANPVETVVEFSQKMDEKLTKRRGR